MEPVPISSFPENELSKLFKIRRTVLKMLEDRGYLVSTIEKIKSYEEWKESFRGKKESLVFLCQKISDEQDLIFVEFTDFDKLGVQQITNFSDRLEKEGVRHGIMIIKGGITPLAKAVNYYSLLN
jgi:DNA-directed RNA polymerase I, II, and III subunit RPABC1